MSARGTRSRRPARHKPLMATRSTQGGFTRPRRQTAMARRAPKQVQAHPRTRKRLAALRGGALRVRAHGDPLQPQEPRRQDARCGPDRTGAAGKRHLVGGQGRWMDERVGLAHEERARHGEAVGLRALRARFVVAVGNAWYRGRRQHDCERRTNMQRRWYTGLWPRVSRPSRPIAKLRAAMCRERCGRYAIHAGMPELALAVRLQARDDERKGGLTYRGGECGAQRP